MLQLLGIPASPLLRRLVFSIPDTLNSALDGRYRIEGEIGRGGMATVYRAHDVRHDRSVALKVLHPELGAVLGVERFLAEIRVTANLQHPNLLPLFDSGEANGLLFYVMPLVEGESLRVRLDRERQLPVTEAVRMISAVLDGLGVAHAQGVVHRDLKPENILLLHGQPVVADFGIALAVSKAGGQRVTQTGLSLGTPQYMSPEQASGDRAIDGRSDIYSAGVILYEMLAGQTPHSGATVQALMAQVLTEKARDVRTLRDTVPIHVALTIDRALSKVPADRFDSASEFARALRDPAATIASLSTAITPATATHKRSIVWPLIALVAVAVAAVAWMFPRTDAPGGSLQVRRQLTFEGTIRAAAISHDGAWLAYVTSDCPRVNFGCPASLKVREVDGTQSVTLLEWPGIERDIKWTIDGSSIAFRSHAPSGDSAGLFVVSRLGGQAHRVHGDVSAFAFTADGKSLLTVDGFAGHQLLTRIDYPSLHVGESKPLPAGWSVHDLATRSKNDLIALTYDGAEGTGVALVDNNARVHDTLEVVTRHSLRWSDDGTSVAFMMIGVGNSDDLVEHRIQGDHFVRARQLVIGQINTALWGLFDMGGVRSMLIRGSMQMEIPVRKLDTQDTVWHSNVQWTGYLSPSDFNADGSRLLAAATDNLGDNLYSFDINTGAPHQEFAGTGTRESATWSPDGKRMVYQRIATDGEATIVISSAAGGGERVVKKSSAIPDWLSDSSMMITEVAAWVEIDTLGKELSRIRIPDSLSGELLNSTVLLSRAVDRRGARVAYWSTRAQAIVIASFHTGKFRVLERTDHELAPIGWTDDDALYYIERGTDKRPLTRLMKRELSASSATVVTTLPDGCRLAIVGAHGKRVLCRIDHPVVDAWLVERTTVK